MVIAVIIIHKPEVILSRYHFPFGSEIEEKANNCNIVLYKNGGWVTLGHGGFLNSNRCPTSVPIFRGYILFVNIQ